MEAGQKYLITTDDWFIAPDGRQYKAVWGQVELVEDSFLGIKTNRNSANWFAKVGSEKKHVIIAGCQIHYAVSCPKKPYTKGSRTYTTDAEHGLKLFDAPTLIYIAE